MAMRKQSVAKTKPLFAPSRPKTRRLHPRSPWKVLIVDDEPEVHGVTRMVLEGFIFSGAELEMIDAYSGEEAKRILSKEPDTAVVLLDVVMESPHAGLDVVRFVRKELDNRLVRIILRTGQPGQAPERDVLNGYDINDYKLKTELTSQKLSTAMTTALRAYRDMRDLERNRKALFRTVMKARAASRARAQFLANMSHELRTPLNGILGLTQLLLATGNDEQCEYLQMVHEAGLGLKSIINNILDFVSLEDGEVQLEEKPFDPRLVLESALEPVSIQAGWKGLKLQSAVEEDVPDLLVGDAARLRQVLINMLANAVKCTERGGIRIKISRLPPEMDDLSEALLQVEVSDTGMGVPPDQRQHIFEPFALGESFLTKRTGGVGLGLSICKNIVRRMGGQIRLVSEPGEGSTFSFTARFGLPAGVAERQ